MVKNEKCIRLTGVEGGMQLADIANKNVGENYLNPRMKYIMVRLDN